MSAADFLTVDLTADEKDRLSKIEFDPLNVGKGQPTRENGDQAAQLAGLLLQRGAIPEIRLAVFSKNDYSFGRGPCARERYRRHGRSDDWIMRDPLFLRWLRYFIFGPALQAGFIQAFKNKIEELEPLTSGDSETLRNFTRHRVREFRLRKIDADEVFKLVLEFSDDLHLARSLRTETMKVTKP